MSLLRLVRPDEPIAIKLVIVGICFLHPGVLVFLVRAFRGPNRDWRDRSEGAAQLSTWGYFWRAYVIYFSPVAILPLLKLVIPFHLPDQLSAFEQAVWEIPLLLVSTLGTWLLFSRDRRGQAALLIASIRGY